LWENNSLEKYYGAPFSFTITYGTVYYYYMLYVIYIYIIATRVINVKGSSIYLNFLVLAEKLRRGRGGRGGVSLGSGTARQQQQAGQGLLR
jgi:hypothetical protein